VGFFDDIFGQPFGGMFDFNGDGKTDFGEEWVGYMIINDCMKEEEEQHSSSYSPSAYPRRSNVIYDSADDDLLDDDLITSVDTPAILPDDSWKIYCEDGSDYGLDPDDFDSEEDYLEALEEAKLTYGDDTYCDDDEGGVGSVAVPLSLTFEITYPGKEQLEAINEADYPNKRTYRAAYGLCELEHGSPFIPSDSSKEKEAERFNFILSGSCIAARYLTPYDGFIYGQAIKENFDLPITFEDEDEDSTVWFPDVFMELAEENPALAVDVWAWCVKEFGPYQKYMKTKPTIYSYITSSTDEYPPEFLDIAIDRLGSDVAFSEALLSRSPELMFGVASFVGRALETNKTKEAQIIFTSFMLNPKVKGKNAEDFINSIISHCSNWDELETMEAFKFYILPIIKKMNDKRIQRILPKITEEVDHYISSVESSEEKYQYARSFAWRNNYINGESGLDPLDYRTEEEYKKAVEEEKYRWRRWHSEARRFNLDVNEFDTEEEYNKALQQKRAEEQEARRKEQEERRKQTMAPDPLADTDKTIYNFCSVVFQSTRQPYAYLTGDLDIKIGDKVVVPVGSEGKEVVATVVSTSQHMRLTAPYPVDKARTVIKKIED